MDTRGLTMLDRARSYLPQLTSDLADEVTLLAHAAQRGVEDGPSVGESYGVPTVAELDVLTGLQRGRLGDRLRLEQERVHWPTAEAELDRVLPPRVSTPVKQIATAPHPTVHSR